MSYVTVNGTDIGEARLCFPLTGAWHADLYAATALGITGSVSINLADALTLKGTVIAGGPYTQSTYIRVLAGAGGWIRQASPKFYQNAPLGMILGDVLGSVGDALSTSSDATARNTVVPAFAVTSATVGATVRALMAYAPAGTSWRFLSDGTFWIGPETWPAFDEDYQVTDEAPQERRIDVGFQVPTLIAGQTVKAQAVDVHVARVEAAVSARRMGARAWWQP